MKSKAKRRILIVEDESVVAEGVFLLLQRLGYEVAGVVATGEDAVKQAFALAPDLVLMDVTLRGPMDGTEASRQIRAAIGLPVVFMSGDANEETLQRVKESEPQGFLVKPFGERDLRVQIELALHRHRLESERTSLLREQKVGQQKLGNLRGLLTLCAGCKRVEDKGGAAWISLEDYLAAKANIECTHSFCPECEKRLYGTHSRAPLTRPPIPPK